MRRIAPILLLLLLLSSCNLKGVGSDDRSRHEQRQAQATTIGDGSWNVSVPIQFAGENAAWGVAGLGGIGWGWCAFTRRRQRQGLERVVRTIEDARLANGNPDDIVLSLRKHCDGAERAINAIVRRVT